jgi:hypothetical protein
VGLVLRQGGRFVWSQVLFCLRSGAWWFPIAMVLLALAVAAAVTAQVVVPKTVYVLF